MEEIDYMKLAESVPADWYTTENSLELTKSIFYDIMIAQAMRLNLVINDDGDLQQLLESLAKERNVPLDEVVLTIQNVATTVGAVRLFNQSFPEIANQFPRDELGNPNYPPKFLAKILEITEEIAIELQNGVLREFADYLSADQS